jgi:hypothetical protein
MESKSASRSHTDRTASRPRRRPPEFYAVLVTTPPVHMYGPISDQFATQRGRPREISWRSKRTRSIHPMLPSISFRRHFALCLVAKQVWESRAICLDEKFRGQLFWDYCGDQATSSRAAIWDPARIRSIELIQELGIIVSDQDASVICSTRKLFTIYSRLFHKGLSILHYRSTKRILGYVELQRDWQYLNIWWNGADFALVLASLLVGHSGQRQCRALWQRLAELREIEIIQPRAQACSRSIMGAVMMCGAAIVATIATAGAALPFTGTLMAGSLGVGAVSATTQEVLSQAEDSRRAKRQTYCNRLQDRFPRLERLF